MTILSAFFLPFLLSVCGILGLLLHDPALNAAPEICEGLSLLQHRGQDACGIITGGPRGRLYQCKANGMVRDVFTQEAIAGLIGGMGIGHGEHTRSTTTGYFPPWMNERVWSMRVAFTLSRSVAFRFILRLRKHPCHLTDFVSKSLM